MGLANSAPGWKPSRIMAFSTAPCGRPALVIFTYLASWGGG
jgi:hypothetical protein